MAIAVKICGLNDHRAMDAALEGGARYLGFMFYPRSPRAVSVKEAIALGHAVPDDRTKVAVMVDPDDALIAEVLPAVDAIQLHGQETPARVQAVKARTGKTVIKALRVAEAADLEPLVAYADVADMILFDAKPPKTPDSLPGGNGLSFDWRLLQGLALDCPWMLSGGLNVENLGDAVRLCAASAVDVSSGVEAARGIKDTDKIRKFLTCAAALSPTA